MEMKTDPEMEFAELEPEDVFLARVAEIRRQAEARDKAAAEAAKPKLVATVSPEIAEAIKANPESLRLSVNRPDEIPVVDRPRRTEIIEVIPDEPTIDGKLTRAWRTDCATGERSVIEFVGGYRQPSGAISTYDPFAALKGSGE
jgi:hypothetical protein